MKKVLGIIILAMLAIIVIGTLVFSYQSHTGDSIGISILAILLLILICLAFVGLLYLGLYLVTSDK